eukprot:5359837-Prymnesium_polylepis.1
MLKQISIKNLESSVIDDTALAELITVACLSLRVLLSFALYMVSRAEDHGSLAELNWYLYHHRPLHVPDARARGTAERA